MAEKPRLPWRLMLLLAVSPSFFPWAVRFLVVPVLGLVPGMVLLDRYYTPPARILGEELYPSGQFGTYPSGPVAVTAAAALYGCVGLLIALVMPRRRAKS